MQQGGWIFLYIFFFLPNETEATYRRLIVVNSNLTNRRSPTYIHEDFEHGAINAIQANFATANIKVYFFQLCSNVWKHIQNIGLQVRYVEEPEFVPQLWMLTVLALLFTSRWFPAICNKIRRNIGNGSEELFIYFEDTYIGRICIDALRGNPIFSIELWNMFHRTEMQSFHKPIIVWRLALQLPLQFLEVFMGVKEWRVSYLC